MVNLYQDIDTIEKFKKNKDDSNVLLQMIIQMAKYGYGTMENINKLSKDLTSKEYKKH